MDKTPYWSQNEQVLLENLESSSQGLSNAQASTRLEKFGPNQLKSKQEISAGGLFLRQFKSPIVIILLFATLLSAVLRDWADAVIILLIVVGSAILSFWQEYGASSAADKLRMQVSLKCSAQREGTESEVPVEEIVPGDIVHLSAGSLIPADGVVLEAKDFFVNQAVLTGETFPVEKMAGAVHVEAGLTDRTNVVFMGTNVRNGSARVVIVETGTGTEFGQIAARLNLRPPETEFERGIKRLGYLLSEIMFVLVLVIFAVNVLTQKPILDSLLFSVALAVGLTPQLLPAVININLAKGSQIMAEKGVIVRRLESIENFGSMDLLCTDKTGTLTQGVVQLDGAFNLTGENSEEIFQLAYLNAKLQTGLANPLDEAILTKGTSLNLVPEKVDEIPYDFVRKQLSVIVQEENSNMMITKGALENVLSVCTRVLQNGTPQDLSADIKEQILRAYADWSAEGYRVLGVAVKDFPVSHGSYTREDEREMDFTGFLIFFDPPKPGISETIQELSRLGVGLKVITGDNHLVAAHAAKAIGLPVGQILTGAQLDMLGDEALWRTVETTTIFSEVDPNQKERIILALKKMGHVVGYMGDGVNDAPSLHSADVGISVENAVDVAKEAADFVLLKQDLAVLQQGILQGRKTFANTLKYVFMATSANFGNMFSVAGASLFLPFLPMLPKQILLINFLTDLPEMTIAGDRVDEEFLLRPRGWNINFIRRFMLVFGPISSFFDFITFGILLWVLKSNQVQFHTGWFIESVFSAGIVVFALRTRHSFLHSKPSLAMLGMTAVVVCFTLMLPYTPLANLLGLAPLPLGFLIAMFGIVLAYFSTAEIAKRWFFKHYDL